MTRNRRTGSGFLSEGAAGGLSYPPVRPVLSGPAEGITAIGLVPAWKEAATAHLEAEHRHVLAESAVEEALETLPDLAPAPEAPDPADYASEATRAALARLEQERQEIDDRIRELVYRAEWEGRVNPDHHEACTVHGKAFDAWHAAMLLTRKQENSVAERHRLAEARDELENARRRMEAAGRHVLMAPIRPGEDVLAVLCVLLYLADLNYGIFEDEEKCLGVDPEALLERLAPVLPVSPSAAPNG